jgi:DNA polymerase-1
MAHLSADPVLVDAFRRGDDIHERTAREVFGTASGLDKYEMRRRAKVINFGIMYGLSAFGLAKSLKIGRAEAQAFIDEYFHRYEGVRKWTEAILEEAKSKKRVTTLFGRIRPVPEVNSSNRNLREFARRTAINAPIQGTAADLIKIAMVSIFDRLRKEDLKSRIILQVHDELVFEAEESEIEHLEVLVREEMEGVAQLKVPLRVDLVHGDSWYHAK